MKNRQLSKIARSERFSVLQRFSKAPKNAKALTTNGEALTKIVLLSA